MSVARPAFFAAAAERARSSGWTPASEVFMECLWAILIDEAYAKNLLQKRAEEISATCEFCIAEFTPTSAKIVDGKPSMLNIVAEVFSDTHKRVHGTTRHPTHADLLRWASPHARRTNGKIVDRGPFAGARVVVRNSVEAGIRVCRVYIVDPTEWD